MFTNESFLQAPRAEFEKLFLTSDVPSCHDEGHVPRAWYEIGVHCNKVLVKPQKLDERFEDLFNRMMALGAERRAIIEAMRG